MQVEHAAWKTVLEQYYEEDESGLWSQPKVSV